jgi:hypothetical protein
VKLSRRFLPLLLLAGLVMAANEASPDLAIRPHNFGVNKGDDAYPENPRDYDRGDFSGFSNWSVSTDAPNDDFTFARIRYPSYGDTGNFDFGRRRHRSGQWRIDYPGADLNLSYRLQQMTSLRVNPNAAIVEIEPEQIRHYPFIYMDEVGQIDLTEPQAKTLRDYMLNGGFVMVDDFWGTDEWEGFYRAFKMIWPDREFVELEMDHDIFHCVFDLKEKPMVAGKGVAVRAHHMGDGRYYEWFKPGSETVHYRAVYDDKKRMCMIICWNTDNGDGWEEEAADPWYFREFSEKYAYPLAINIIYYAMTH